jgi:DNA-binding MarR family transcriptional regulator
MYGPCLHFAPLRFTQGVIVSTKPYTGPRARRYFHGVADARFVIRRVFRIVDERAKSRDLDPLEHQALIQIYGLRDSEVRVGTVAERLDIPPAFASKLVKALTAKGYVSAATSPHDQRVSHLSATAAGATLLAEIDADVRVHVGFFTRGLTAEQKDAAFSIFQFYVGTPATASKVR